MDVITLGEVKKARKDIALLSTQLEQLKTSFEGLLELVVLAGTTQELGYLGEEIVSIPIPHNSNSFLIKSVYLEGTVGTFYKVDILNSVGVGGFLSYSNNSSGVEVYDVVSLPYFDDDSTGKLHIKIKNLSNEPGTIKIRVAGITM